LLLQRVVSRGMQREVGSMKAVVVYESLWGNTAVMKKEAG
jgi:hypothetical protein